MKKRFQSRCFPRILPVLAFGLFLNINAAASMVSFYVIETGLPENRLNNEHSIQWENAFMDVFFDAGHIVSNSPIIRFEEKPQGDIFHSADISIMEARNWGIDYIIVAQLDYTSVLHSPEFITIFIYKVNTNEKVFEGQMDGRTYRSTREEYDGIRNIIRSLTRYITG